MEMEVIPKSIGKWQKTIQITKKKVLESYLWFIYFFGVFDSTPRPAKPIYFMLNCFDFGESSSSIISFSIAIILYLNYCLLSIQYLTPPSVDASLSPLSLLVGTIRHATTWLKNLVYLEGIGSDLEILS